MRYGHSNGAGRRERGALVTANPTRGELNGLLTVQKPPSVEGLLSARLEVRTVNTPIIGEPRISPHPEHREGRIARKIEQQTAKLPSDLFFWVAGGSIVCSLALKIAGSDKTANFVAQWAPTFLILGLYNKIVKLYGSEGH